MTTTDDLAGRIEALETELAAEKAERAKADAQMSTVFREWLFYLEGKAGQTEGRFDDLLKALTTTFNAGHVVLESVARRCLDEDLENVKRGVFGGSASEDDQTAVFSMTIPT